MEAQQIFKVYYDSQYIKSVVAHTKWEAIELVYSRIIVEHPTLIRKKFKAKKL